MLVKGATGSHDDAIKWKHFLRYWPIVREITGHRWIPFTNFSGTEIWLFFYLRLDKRLSKQSWWFETPPRLLWRHWGTILVQCILPYSQASAIHLKLAHLDICTLGCQIERPVCFNLFCIFLPTWLKLIWPYPYIFSGVIWQHVLSLSLTGQLKLQTLCM